MEDIQKLKYRIDYQFKNMELAKRALTHRSYAAEENLDYDNQRLEFLGDAVLEIIFTEYLFKRYPDEPEGMLTQMRAGLAQEQALAALAREIELGDFLRLGHGEIETGGNDRDSTLADAFEALLGAIYLDSGMKAAKQFILPLVEKLHPEPNQLLLNLNPKGTLQELTQKHWNTAPSYEVIEVMGPDHAPSYTVNVLVNQKVLGSGKAQKRKVAESYAARNALEYIDNENLLKNNGQDS